MSHITESCHIWMSHVTYDQVMSRMQESCHGWTSHVTCTSQLTVSSETLTSLTSMGWLRLLGSLKLQVSYVEYGLFYRALLQKKPIILRSLLTEATPYMSHESSHIIRVSLKIEIFAEYSLFYRALLQKSPIKETAFCSIYLTSPLTW